MKLQLIVLNIFFYLIIECATFDVDSTSLNSASVQVLVDSFKKSFREVGVSRVSHY
jgi:hypothetical protein